MFIKKGGYSRKYLVLIFLLFGSICFIISSDSFIQIKQSFFSFVGLSTTAFDCAFNGSTAEVLVRIKNITNCRNNFARYRFQRRAGYFVLYNYVISSRRFKCEESVTYVTQSDYTFLNNLIPLLERWRGPISIALHAPGTDFAPTLDSIAYLRSCTPLVKEFVTFHIYFGEVHVPQEVPPHTSAFKMSYNCSLRAPFNGIARNSMYVTKNNLTYPINIGRNIARTTSETHFVLTSDIELYPSPNLIDQFLIVVAGCKEIILRYKPAVFALHVFEIKTGLKIPRNKRQLQEMLRKGVAIPFHRGICPECHAIPKSEQWQKTNVTENVQIFNVGKRTGKFYHWEPFYIGTKKEPIYDERLTWEGMSDKIIQGYIMCLMDYSFLILDNAFLIHRSGIKKSNPKKNQWREKLVNETNQMIENVILPEINLVHGKKSECRL